MWDALGGEAGVKQIIDDFVDLAAKDPKVNFTRNGKYTLDAATLDKVKKELVKQLGYRIGGARYQAMFFAYTTIRIATAGSAC